MSQRPRASARSRSNARIHGAHRTAGSGSRLLTPEPCPGSSVRTSLEIETVQFCSRLVQFDTSSPGAVETPAAVYVADLLQEAGLDVTVVEPEPGRASVVTRIAGEDRSRPALLVHGHLDVVPVDERDWGVDPFGGEFDFSSQFHAPDERVPIEALEFGACVMHELLLTA